MSADLDNLVTSVIQRIAVGPDRGRDISAAEAEQIMQAILDQQVDPVQLAVILIALRMKRESKDEMLGLFNAMQKQVDIVEVELDQLVCLADPFDGYQRCLPMTPFLPATLAACGLPAVLAGVESVGPKFGVTAQQVYHCAGIEYGDSSHIAKQHLQAHGWAYVDQQYYAPKLFALQDIRARIIKRSAVTTLERLLHPIRATGQTHAVLGYVHKAYPEIYAAVAQQAGFDSAILSKGVEGGLAPATNKPLRQYHVDFSLGNSDLAVRKTELTAGVANDTAAYMVSAGELASPERTLELGLEVLDGTPNAARNSLVLAAAHILWVYQSLASFEQAVEKVQHCLDNGLALLRFNALRESPQKS